MEAIIDTRLRASVCMHNILHVFHTGRGMRTAILELNLAQELANMYQDPMFLVFLNLQDSYNTIYHGRLLTALEGYGAVPCMCRLLVVFWDQKEVVTCQNW